MCRWSREGGRDQLDEQGAMVTKGDWSLCLSPSDTVTISGLRKTGSIEERKACSVPRYLILGREERSQESVVMRDTIERT